MRFEPEGVTGDPEFPFVTSPLDYIARLALARFGRKDDVEEGAHTCLENISCSNFIPTKFQRTG